MIFIHLIQYKKMNDKFTHAVNDINCRHAKNICGEKLNCFVSCMPEKAFHIKKKNYYTYILYHIHRFCNEIIALSCYVKRSVVFCVTFLLIYKCAIFGNVYSGCILYVYLVLLECYRRIVFMFTLWQTKN